MACCVPRCGNNKKCASSSISYHEFPSDPFVASKWIRSINLTMPNGGSWHPNEDSRVCSDHFLPNDFRPNMVRRKLKVGSIPSVFENLKKSTTSYSRTVIGDKRKTESPNFPLIVKVAKPDDSDDEIVNEVVEHDVSPRQEVFGKSRILSSPSPRNDSEATAEGLSANKSHSSVQSSIVKENNCGQNTTTKNKASVFQSPKSVSPKPTQAKNTSASSSKQACNSDSSKPKPIRNQVQNQNPPMDLIEIGPSTFLKINPEVITVTEKVTPAGNTVLQFVMNPNVTGIDAKSLFQVGSTPKSSMSSNSATNHKLSSDQEVSISSSGSSSSSKKDSTGISASTSSAMKEEDMTPDTTSHNDEGNCNGNTPVLLTTKYPIRRSLGYSVDKQDRYFKALKEKNKLIHTLRSKVSKLVKKVEELETRCVVQERQLNFPSMKKLKTIKKNADKGEPHATFILEQIRGYQRSIPIRWSPTTMNQCSVWCRKAPYAYEYFKKADLFRLPALVTVKRYIKNHPEIAVQIKNRTLSLPGLNSEDSSSDFEFDESDENGIADDDDVKEEVSLNDDSRLVLPESSKKSDLSDGECGGMVLSTSIRDQSDDRGSYGNSISEYMALKIEPQANAQNKNNETLLQEVPATMSIETSPSENGVVSESHNHLTSVENSKDVTIADQTIPVSVSSSSSLERAVTSVSLNGQEIILQPGNVIQLNTAFGDGNDFENQYFVIPNSDDNVSGDHQYSHPVSFVIQNGEEENQVLYVTENGTVTDSVPVSITN